MSDKIEFMLKFGHPDAVRDIVNKRTQEYRDAHGHLDSYNDAWALDTAMLNPRAPSDVVDKAYKYGAGMTIERAAKHPNLSPELHKKALKHPSAYMREAALRNPQTTDEQLKHTQIYDSNYAVAKLAVDLRRASGSIK